MYTSKKGCALETTHTYTRESDGSSYELYMVALCSPSIPGNWHRPPEGGEMEAVIITNKKGTPPIDITDEDEIALIELVCGFDCDWSLLDDYDNDVTGHLIVL